MQKTIEEWLIVEQNLCENRDLDISCVVCLYDPFMELLYQLLPYKWDRSPETVFVSMEIDQ